jgi:ankyrin repeat protein
MKNQEELALFLLLRDQGAVSTPYDVGDTGELPLHLACKWQPLSIVKLVYNAYPEALHRQNDYEETPLNIARDYYESDVVVFFETQVELEHQAHENVQPDRNGQLLIHCVLLTSEPSLGTIKLMAAANPASLTAAKNQGFIPLHFACTFGHAGVIKYIVEANEELLKVKTSRG